MRSSAARGVRSSLLTARNTSSIGDGSGGANSPSCGLPALVAGKLAGRVRVVFSKLSSTCLASAMTDAEVDAVFRHYTKQASGKWVVLDHPLSKAKAFAAAATAKVKATTPPEST